MASQGSTTALIKKREDELARMPPPPVKRIKRPAEVLDEDDYTDKLSEIITRDYYPGLHDARVKEEYVAALDSRNPVWIQEASDRLRRATNPEAAKKIFRTTSDTRFDTARPYNRAQDTPASIRGGDTPASTIETNEHNDTSSISLKVPETMSLSSFQAKYTSEDNASFNDLLDKQNAKRRQQHAHLWTPDQRILPQRLIQQRQSQALILKEKQDYEYVNGNELVPMTVGATSNRPAKPDSWKTTDPTNNFMFLPSTSQDEIGHQTVQDVKQAMSKAGPKTIVHENTRFPPTGPRHSAEDKDDASSIHTSFIARRIMRAGTDIITEDGDGGETPRVNGYAFVDEDEEPPAPVVKQEPSYRDLLAGQGTDVNSTFRIRDTQKREDLHKRLVDKDKEKHRQRERDRTPLTSGREAGGMTPAGRRLATMLGGGSGGPTPGVKVKGERLDWTPARTPRREKTAVT